MSMLNMVGEALQHATVDLAAPRGGGDGIMDWVNLKSKEAIYTIRLLGVAVVSMFIIFIIAKSRMAAATIVISMLVGGGALWGLWNITDLRDRVDNEIGSISRLDDTLGVGGPILVSAVSGLGD